MENTERGWFRIQLGPLDRWIDLLTQPRSFNGRQWYFSCPETGRSVTGWEQTTSGAEGKRSIVADWATGLARASLIQGSGRVRQWCLE